MASRSATILVAVNAASAPFSQFSTGTVTCLSLVIGGQQTIDKRDIECQVKIHGSLGYPLADEVKMACFSLKEAPQQNNGIKSTDVG